MSGFSIPPVSPRPIVVPSETSSSTPSDSHSSTNPSTNQSGSSLVGVNSRKRERSSDSNRELSPEENLFPEAKKHHISSTAANNQSKLEISDANSLANQSGSSSTGDVLLKRRFSSDSNKGVSPESNLPAAPKKQKTSSTTADNPPKSEILDLPIPSKKPSYSYIEKIEDLEQRLLSMQPEFGKTTGEIGLAINGNKCTAKTFKTLLKHIAYLHLNGVSFTEKDIPDTCDLAKLKSLYLNVNLPSAAVVVLLNKIPANIEGLSLRLNQPLSAGDIAQLARFLGLKELMIDVPGLSGDDAVALLNTISTENLKTLELKLDKPLRADEIARLIRLPALKELTIDASYLSGADVVAVLNTISPEDLKNLETLELRFKAPLSVDDIKALSTFPALKKLTIDVPDLSGDVVVTLLGQICPKSLKTLDLKLDESDPLTDKEIAGFPNLPALEELLIDSAGLSGDAVVALINKVSPNEESTNEKKSENKNLRTLLLNLDASLTVDQIAQFPNLPALDSLTLGGSDLSGDTTVALTNKASKKLETLSLSFTPALTVEQRKKLSKYPELKLLELEHSKFSGADIAALFPEDPLKLETLILNECGPLSVADINAFPSFPKLKTVYAHGIKFDSDEARKAFDKTFNEKLNPEGEVFIEM